MIDKALDVTNAININWAVNNASNAVTVNGPDSIIFARHPSNGKGKAG
jgi:hypothetical protein